MQDETDLHVDISPQNDVEEGLVVLPRLHSLLQAGLRHSIQVPEVHFLQAP